MKVGELSLEMVGAMLMMLDQCAQEIDRLRAVPEVGGRGHLKPVILDARGQAIPPPPIAHQLAAERREQYDRDRFEAVQMPVSLDRWRVFALRWGLPPPPGGWDSGEQITNVIHAIRLGIKQTSYVEKHFSAVYLTSRGITLPQPAKLVGGVLSGVDLPD